MRLTMRTLLADRLKFRMHTEVREVPVLALVLFKPGRLGTGLKGHPVHALCPTSVAPDSAACFFGCLPSTRSSADYQHFAAKSWKCLPAPGALTLRSAQCNDGIPRELSKRRRNIRRPLINATGLTGAFDIVTEWAPQGDASTRFQLHTGSFRLDV